ncbi:MAG: Phosphodiesterase/alkaline phosphatase [Myxococcales bacterium]|nr:Phosphodiesterase/alkaline phosphatase [Myxococcales bacterium]
MRYPGVVMNGGPSRRDVLRLAGVSAGTLLLGCGDNQTSSPPGADQAVAILEPTNDAFIVSIWAPFARLASVSVQVGRTPFLSTMIGIDPESGQAMIDVSGLEPSQAYEVTVTTNDGVRLGPHHVRTAPSADDARPVRIAVSADLDPSPEFTSDILSHLTAADPEVYVSIGDFPYTDNGPPAVTVTGYRARHAELRTDPGVRSWLETVGVRAIYDDHEFRNDWDAMFEAAERDRFVAAMQVWDEFFPIRHPVDNIRYRRWMWGANIECFLLDCRRFRSANAAPDDANKTMLGAQQRAWLVDGVISSTAAFKVVFTSIPLAFGIGNDHWSSFTTERDAIFAALVGTPGVLFVSGDQHSFGAFEHAHGVREFQIGPLARGVIMPGPLVPGVLFRSAQYNFGLIDVDGDTLTFSGVGATGEVFYKETLTAAQLTPVS